jgi:DNA polymerase III delta subunit
MISTFSGSNSLMMSQNVRERISTFIKNVGDFGFERISASEASYAQIFEAVQATPFLSDRRMIVIHSPSSNKELAENITKVLDAVQDTTDVVFVEPKFDKRSVLYKTLKKRTEYSEFNELDEQNLVRWACDYVASQGGTISSSDARLLVNRVGLNQLQISHEIDKLLCYKTDITKASIELLTEQTPQSTVFDLLDAALSGQTTKAEALYREQRRLKVEPHAILALLGWQLHVLALVKAGNGKSPDEIAKDSKINPYVVRKSASLARSIHASSLKSLIARTLELDIQLKSQTIDADEAMQVLITTI